MAGGEGTVAVGDAQGAGGVGAGGAYGADQGDVHLEHGRAQTGHLVAGGAGEGAVGQGAATALKREVLPAQLVLAVGQAAAAQAVGDDDDAPVAEELEGQAHHGGVDVHTVGDDLGGHAWHLATGHDGAGLAVVQRRHGVEEVRHVLGTCLEGRARRVVVGAHVRERHAHLVCHGGNEVEVAGLFGGHVHELDASACRRLQLVELLRRGPAHKVGVLGPHLVGRDVGALHVHPHKLGLGLAGLERADI